MNKMLRFSLTLFIAAALLGCMVKDFDPQKQIDEELIIKLIEIDKDISKYVDENVERMTQLKGCLKRSSNPKLMCWEGIYEQAKFQAHLCGLIAQRNYLNSYISRHTGNENIPAGKFDYQSECNSDKEE